jgi:hypothetical protein
VLLSLNGHTPQSPLFRATACSNEIEDIVFRS